MKRKLYLSLLGLGCALILKAQDPEPAIAKVHYIFKHVNDSSDKSKFLRDEVVTYLGQGSSYYTSYSSVRAEEDMKKQLDAPDFDGKLILTKNTTAINASLLINQHSQSMLEIQRVASDNLSISEEFPKQDWQILDQTKEIGDYLCQKAVCEFKGRKYSAWFTTELPFTGGPWKLNGLPGLILSAADSTGSVSFEYAGFDKLATQDFLIQPPANAVKSSKKEAAKLLEAFTANPNAYMQAKRASQSSGISSTNTPGGATIVISGSGQGGNKSAGAIDPSRIKSMTIKNNDNYQPSKLTNNPIELKP